MKTVSKAREYGSNDVGSSTTGDARARPMLVYL